MSEFQIVNEDCIEHMATMQSASIDMKHSSAVESIVVLKLIKHAAKLKNDLEVFAAAVTTDDPENESWEQ